MTDTYRRKLVEVALPLDEINAASVADKKRKTGTIRNLHKWFAPAPLPAWRALLFAALVDDPEDEEKRAYLLDVIKRLVAKGADLPDDDTLAEARNIIAAQFPDGVPTVMDPFCGGGSTLVEAQRLGLPTFGSDLNPVPVLITRTLTELLPKVYGQQPLHPEKVTPKPKKGRSKRNQPADGALFGRDEYKTYSGYEGLVRDVTHYAEQIGDRAWEQLRDHYPHQPGESPTAWLWARTATCPNPACGIETILTTNWWLSKKKNDLAWIEPRVENGKIDLIVRSGQRTGSAPAAPKIGNGVFACLRCGATLDGPYLRREGQEDRLGLLMTAVVQEAKGRRTYREPKAEDRQAADVKANQGMARVPVVKWRSVNVPDYGIDTWDKLYTSRQLLALTTFADLVAQAHREVLGDSGTEEWADAVSTVLGMAVGRLAQYQSSQVRWFIDSRSGTGQPLPAFGRNDLPMTWDFAETSPLSRQG